MGLTVSLTGSDRFAARATLDAASGRLLLRFVGQIDDEADFDGIWQYVAKLEKEVRHVTFDFEEVVSINSVGVLRWGGFLKRVSSRMSHDFGTLGFALLQQALFASVLGRMPVTVAAFLVPFRCGGCARESLVRLAVKELKGTPSLRTPQLPCEECSGTMTFDDLPADYENLLTQIRYPGEAVITPRTRP